MKKIVILRHDGGELANQLWNYASIYAYAKERKAGISNPSFYEYASWFPAQCNLSTFSRVLASQFQGYTKRKYAFKRRFYRKIYALYSAAASLLKKDALIISGTSTPYYLPPSTIKEELIKKERHDTLYMSGWLFRNPEGMKKYRGDILTFFTPTPAVRNRNNILIKNFRASYQHIVGVHIRQGDYKSWQGGAYYINETRTYQILKEYLAYMNRDASQTLFLLTSDGSLDSEAFQGLHIEISHGNAVEDLFLLSLTDTIIGSDSTYGDFAAYYGNIPHIIMTKNPIDWEYYESMKTYTMGKYMTWVHF